MMVRNEDGDVESYINSEEVIDSPIIEVVQLKREITTEEWKWVWIPEADFILHAAEYVLGQSKGREVCKQENLELSFCGSNAVDKDSTF